MSGKLWAILLIIVAIAAFIAGIYVGKPKQPERVVKGKPMGDHCGSAPNVCVISYRQLKLDEASGDAHHQEINVSVGDQQRIYMVHPGKDFKVTKIDFVSGTPHAGGKCPDNPFPDAKIPGNSSGSGQDAYFDTGVPTSKAWGCHYRFSVDDCNGHPCPVDPHIYIDQ